MLVLIPLFSYPVPDVSFSLIQYLYLLNIHLLSVNPLHPMHLFAKPLPLLPLPIVHLFHQKRRASFRLK
jgi:hypothetical protein